MSHSENHTFIWMNFSGIPVATFCQEAFEAQGAESVTSPDGVESCVKLLTLHAGGVQ